MPILLIAQLAGGLLAKFLQAKGHGMAATLVTEGETAVRGIIEAAKSQVESDPTTELTAADVHAAVINAMRSVDLLIAEAEDSLASRAGGGS